MQESHNYKKVFELLYKVRIALSHISTQVFVTSKTASRLAITMSIAIKKYFPSMNWKERNKFRLMLVSLFSGIVIDDYNDTTGTVRYTSKVLSENAVLVLINYLGGLSESDYRTCYEILEGKSFVDAATAYPLPTIRTILSSL